MRLTTLPLLLVTTGTLMAVACGSDGDTQQGGNPISGGSGGSSASGGSGGSSANGGTSANGGSAADSFGGSIHIDGGGNGGTGGLNPDSGCASESVSGDRVPANMLFVIDRSGSMKCNPPPTQDSNQCESRPEKLNPAINSKWEDTRLALEAALEQLSAQPNISVGVNMFPRDSQCAVTGTPNIQVNPLNATQLAGIKAFFGTVDPAGRTPLAGASILSYGHLLAQLRAGNLPGNKFIVLITDGFETCAPSELNKLVNVDVPNATALNFRTFVIGAPGSEGARSLLSQIAKAGGTAASSSCVADSSGSPEVGDCHFDLTNVSTPQDFADQLSQALEQISGSVLTCEFDIPSSPTGGEVDLNKVNVKVTPDGQTPIDLEKDTANCDTTANGWQYNADGTKIVLCGAACDTAKEPGSAVQIVLGCPSVIK